MPAEITSTFCSAVLSSVHFRKGPCNSRSSQAVSGEKNALLELSENIWSRLHPEIETVGSESSGSPVALPVRTV